MRGLPASNSICPSWLREQCIRVAPRVGEGQTGSATAFENQSLPREFSQGGKLRSSSRTRVTTQSWRKMSGALFATA